MAVTSRGIVGDSVFMDVVSVGATINIMLPRSRVTVLPLLKMPQGEPSYIVDTANFSTSAVQRSAVWVPTRQDNGRSSPLHGVTYAIIPDMIEAGAPLWSLPHLQEES